jgi:hypothetical protein
VCTTVGRVGRVVSEFSVELDICAMSSDLKKVNSDLLEDFIRLYESQSCPWRIKFKHDNDKVMWDAAYDIIFKNMG